MQESLHSPTALLASLPESLTALLRTAAQVAAGQGARLWLVGGVVRDLLRGLAPERDVDLALEGDAGNFATALAAALGGRVAAQHSAFGTATLALSDRMLDLARTRSEHYPAPAALPQVQPAPIAVDLLRRDFSVNAMALELCATATGLAAGAWLDPFGGQADLRDGVLRLLHSQSLRDDPTRILRGLRLATRLQLHLDPASANQLADARIGAYLGMLSPERVASEICLALDEQRPDAVVALADTWEVTPQLAPDLCATTTLRARAERLAASGVTWEAEARLVWLGLLCYDLPPATRAALGRHYRAPSDAARLLRDLDGLPNLARQLRDQPPASQVDRLLRPYSVAALAVLHYAEAGPPSVTVRDHLHSLRLSTPPLDGNDLRRLGVAPGPHLGRLLADLRAAWLDGLIADRAAAEAWARDRAAATDDHAG